mgnify:CR=1 FL=1
MIERSKRIELRVTSEELKQIRERMQETGNFQSYCIYDPNGNSRICA